MKHKLNTVSLWFTVLAFLASVLNFLYYPIVARLLNLSQFGDVQVGVSFIMQAAALFSSLNLVALLLSAKKGSEKGIVQKLEQVLIVPSLLGAALVSIFAYPISGLLQLHSPGLLYLLSFIFILNIPASTWVGTLQGEGAFIKSGAISLLSSLTKILASTLLILVGLGAYGAILGIMIGSIVIIPLCYALQDSNSLMFAKTFRLPNKDDFKILAERKSVFLILVSFILLSLISTFDVIAAKTHLTPIEAGEFAQLSIISKIPYFALLPVSIILFGKFIKKPERQGRAIFIYCLGVLLLSLATYFMLPLISHALFSLSLDSETIRTTLWLLAAFGFYTVIFLIIYLLVSRGHTTAIFLIAIVAFLLSFASLTLATTTETIARNYALSLVVVMLLSLLYLGYNREHVKE